MTDRTYRVEGMSCAHCETAVEDELGKLPGVERTDADFERGTVGVRYDEDRVTAGDVRAAIEKAGYALAI